MQIKCTKCYTQFLDTWTLHFFLYYGQNFEGYSHFYKTHHFQMHQFCNFPHQALLINEEYGLGLAQYTILLNQHNQLLDAIPTKTLMNI